MAKKQTLLTYSVLDDKYSNGSIRYLRGLRDAAAGVPNVGTIDNPSDTGLPLLPTDPDPKLFSFVYKGEARILLAKVVTPSSGTAPYTTWTLVAVPDPAFGGWNTLARDIRLQYDGVDVATNPYGVAQVGNWLYIVDEASQKICTLGVNELNGLENGNIHTLANAPFDLGGEDITVPLNTDYRGQAIIALSDGETDYVYAVFTYTNDPWIYQDPGALVRLTADRETGELSYGDQVTVGMNPQEIVPVTPSGGGTQLLIPAIGGIQNAGTTNGTKSVISVMPAFGAWPAPTPDDPPIPATAPDLVTGNANPGATPAYDFHSIAAAFRPDDNGTVYILTLDYAAGYNGNDWALYRTTVSHLLGLVATPPVDIANAGFKLIDSGTAPAGYFWSILYENGEIAANDRLWFFRGTPLLVTPAKAYTAPPQTANANAFYDFGEAAGQIGGQSVDWADLTVETLRQAQAGVSLKHSFRSVIKAPKAPEMEEDK
jgi:hypothetical protein